MITTPLLADTFKTLPALRSLGDLADVRPLLVQFTPQRSGGLLNARRLIRF